MTITLQKASLAICRVIASYRRKAKTPAVVTSNKMRSIWPSLNEPRLDRYDAGLSLEGCNEAARVHYVSEWGSRVASCGARAAAGPSSPDRHTDPLLSD